MKKPASPVIAARKRPRQGRSTQLVADVLEAALRVLARDGAQKFSTVRVAEEAGVSVGSLYQYFPNKEAILFRLQTDEWRDTGELLREILHDPARPPLERLRRAVRTFFLSEREEAELRAALGDAASLYRAAPETRAQREAALGYGLELLAEALPGVPAPERALAADVLMTSLSAIGKRLSEESRSRAQTEAWADVVGDMLVHYLTTLAEKHPPPANSPPAEGGPGREPG